jgi:hypothetical protein
MKTQSMRSQHILWLLLLTAAFVIGFFMLTVKPAAQAPDGPAKGETAQPVESATKTN